MFSIYLVIFITIAMQLCFLYLENETTSILLFTHAYRIEITKFVSIIQSSLIFVPIINDLDTYSGGEL